MAAAATTFGTRGSKGVHAVLLEPLDLIAWLWALIPPPRSDDDRPALERLLRYAARPAFSHKRLSRTPSGKVCYRLPKPYYTGQTEVVLE
ncbi:MAG: hypothetical protein EXR75_15895, partial [Myxococcales bacterium]|nr:hypothetical protein [Myxococcales bacterium]